jgi:3-isopropylmalate/(R)-2-methylmalate dehydratase small subunit
MVMQKFIRLKAIAAPLPWANVNTDDIFPGPGASPLVRAGRTELITDRSQMGANAFAAYRWNLDGTPIKDFVLNQPPYNRAGILIARENFGCGSSREHAVWCLDGIGIRCVIAPSFGDIFYNNCFKNGMLPIRLPEQAVEGLLAQAAVRTEATFEVDLEEQMIVAPDGSRHRFEIGDYQRHALLNGLDEIAATLARLPQIEAHEARYYEQRPWLTET